MLEERFEMRKGGSPGAEIIENSMLLFTAQLMFAETVLQGELVTWIPEDLGYEDTDEKWGSSGKTL